MTGRPGISRLLLVAALGALAGCRASHPIAASGVPIAPAPDLPGAVGPVDVRVPIATGTLLKPPVIQEVGRAAPPDESVKQRASALLGASPDETALTASSSLSPIVALPRMRVSAVIRENLDAPKLPVPPERSAFPPLPVPPPAPALFATQPEPEPVTAPAPRPASTAPVVPASATADLAPLPSIPQAQLPPLPGSQAQPSATPAVLPPLPSSPATLAAPLAPPVASSDAPTGQIMVGERLVTFEALSKLVDGQAGGSGSTGCATCGGDCPPGRPCAAGGRKCEPFPCSHNPLKRFVGLVYENVCCPDPCYQPKWEPLADSAFFVDAARPKNHTRIRWDYGNHFSYPDRGEYFWARGDGNGKGPKATNPAIKSVPYIDYHELSLVSEIAAGPASVAISVPYRTVNATPFGKDAAGFADMTVTAKSLLVDSELFLLASQFRTYIPTGNFGKGLGTGHVALEPGLLFGLRLAPDTYLQGQVLEWIPIAGDPDYAGAHLRYGLSLNHVLWRPVRDVQLIATLELSGISFQDGLYTDPVLGPRKLSGQNALSVGSGCRLFFCDTFDIGIAGNFGITGKYLVREQLRFEMRFRY